MPDPLLGQSGSPSDNEAIVYLRGLMCSPGGRDYVERQVIKPFGYVIADAQTATSAVEMPLEEMGG